MSLARKNHNRSQYTFANINLLGPCNFDCRWCLGKDLGREFAQYNHLNTYFTDWPNFYKFLQVCREEGIQQIYLTGQNTDSLMYKYLNELMDYLDGTGFYIGLRTNGLLAQRKMNAINKATVLRKGSDAVSFTVLTYDPDTHEQITGNRNVPDWRDILNLVRVPFRVATVIDRYNAREFMPLMGRVQADIPHNSPDFQYVQVRCVSTDHRSDELYPDIIAYHNLLHRIREEEWPHVGSYETADIYAICGIPCCFWKTVETTANSINYFTNGVVSKEYFIIEGYEQNKPKWLGCKPAQMGTLASWR